MDGKEMLMNRIRQYDFALKELNLYLDTHPNCRRALSAFDKYKKLKNDAAKEYAARFGPIIPEDCTDQNSFSWVSDPWPWERS